MAPSTSRQSPPPSKRRCFDSIGAILPDDVIFMILSWLPVISLLRFKCVSKSWLSLISSSQHFYKTHLSNSKTCQKIAFCFKGTCFTQDPFFLQKHSAFLQQLDPLKVAAFIKKIDSSSSNKKKNDVVKNCHFAYSFVGSSEGLICLTFKYEAKDRVVLWNPATQKLKFLPCCPVKSTLRDGLTYAFGYDRFTNDYKVAAFCNVTFFQLIDRKRVNREVVIVYSLKTSQWKKINGYLPARIRNESPVFAMGKFYWSRHVMLRNQTLDGAQLFYLDLETESNNRIDIPDYTQGELNRYTVAAISEQCHIHVLAAHETYANIWKLEEGNVAVWTKLCTFGYDDIGIRSIYSNIFQMELYRIPFHVLINGEIMLLLKGRFMIVNPKDGSFSYSDNIFPNHGATICTYVESLVSI